MATADEILAAELGLEDNWFEIDLLSRQIIIPKAITHLGVKSDADVMHVRFKLPRFYYGIDFSEFKIGIDYTNAEGEEDRYEPEDVSIIDNAVTFTWVVGRHAALYDGTVTFGLCAKKLNPDDPDDPFNEFHTTKASLPILDGVETCEEAIVMHTDLLEQWRERLFGERDSLLSSIEEYTAMQMAAIETKAARTLETIPEDYTETYRLAHDSVRTRANAIVCSGEGEVVNIRDASDDYLRGLRIFGKTTQLQTTGAQLIDGSKWPDTTDWGVTINNDGTGRITVHGKSTESFNVNVPIEGLTPGTYYVSGEIPGKMVTFVCFNNAEGYHEFRAPGSFTLDGTETSIRCCILILAVGVTFDKDVIYPMLNRGDSPLPWEPYSGGVASPSPSYPQHPESVDNPKVTVCGKNLLNLPQVIEKTSTLYNYDLYTGQNGAGQTIPSSYFDTLPILKAGVPYYFSYDIEGDDTDPRISIQKVDPDGTTNMTGVLLERPGVVCVDEDTMITLRANSNTAYTIKNLQLEIGTERTTYEPYKDLPSITVVNSLRGIPVESGGNYVDSNGQQWICDEIDLERGVYIQRIGTIVLDGADIIGRELNIGDGSNVFYTYSIFPRSKLGYLEPYIGSYCTHMSCYNGRLFQEMPDNAIRIEETDHISCRYDALSTSDEYNSWLFDCYYAGNPVTIKGVLRTPIETYLAPEIIEAFKAMRTNFPITTVLNDSGAWMEVKYNADTKTFLENISASSKPTDLYNGVIMADRTTGKKYVVYINNGKLTMAESEG